MSYDPATKWDKMRAAIFVLIMPVILLVLAAINMWHGHGDLW